MFLAKALAHLAAILCQVYPTAIGRIPPDFLVRAVRFPPNKIGLTAGCHLPSNSMFVKAVIANRKSCPKVLQLMRSIRFFGRKPSGPPEEPAGKVRIALETSLSETCNNNNNNNKNPLLIKGKKCRDRQNETNDLV